MNAYTNPLAGARWIGLPEGSIAQTWTGAPQTAGAFFRRVFAASAGQRKLLHISASSRYALFVNGVFVQNGPCKGDQWRQYVDTLDISPLLCDGDNVLGLQVFCFSTNESDEMGLRDGGPSAVHAKPTGPLLLLSDEGEGELVATALPGWQALPETATEWIHHDATWYVGAKQCIHGDRLPRDLHSPHTTSPWLDAKSMWVETPLPWGEMPPFRLQERPIPLMTAQPRAFMHQQHQRPGEPGVAIPGGTVRAGQRAFVELDAGELVTGYPRLKVRGGRGATITLRCAECYVTPEGKAQRDDWARGRLEGYEDRILPSGLGDLFQTFWFRTFRFVRVEITTGGEDVTIESLDYLDSSYPLERVSAVRSMANPWVEQLFHISANTLQRCMHETYEDCPYYEQLQYIQDTRLEMLFTYGLSADARMALRTMEDYHCSLLPEGILQSRYPSRRPQVIPGFALYWIMMLEDYLNLTGDAALPRRYRPTIDAVLDWFDRRIDEDGLFRSTEHWPYFDWVEQWKIGVPNAAHDGASAVFNLHYALGLQSAAALMRATGRAAVADEYIRRADAMLQAVEATCWDEAQGLYREGPHLQEFSQHTQVWAVLTGLAKGQRARAILNRALDDKSLLPCSFTMMFFLFRALEKAGLYERTRELWDMWKGLLTLGCTTVPEIPVQPRSECHAWGALALWDFPRYFLGVREAEPGWSTAVIDPQALWLGDCQGVAATPKGLVRVNWLVKDGVFSISGELPDGLSATLKLPDGTAQQVGGDFTAQCALA